MAGPSPNKLLVIVFIATGNKYNKHRKVLKLFYRMLKAIKVKCAGIKKIMNHLC